MNYKLLGQQIRRSRKAKGLTQAELSELADVSPSYISHIERGATKLSLEVFTNIALALDVSADQLLFGTLPCKAATYTPEIEAILDGHSPQTQAAVMELIRTFSDVVAEIGREKLEK